MQRLRFSLRTAIQLSLALQSLFRLLQRLAKRHDLRPLEADPLARLHALRRRIVRANVEELVSLVHPDRLLIDHSN